MLQSLQWKTEPITPELGSGMVLDSKRAIRTPRIYREGAPAPAWERMRREPPPASCWAAPGTMSPGRGAAPRVVSGWKQLTTGEGGTKTRQTDSRTQALTTWLYCTPGLPSSSSPDCGRFHPLPLTNPTRQHSLRFRISLPGGKAHTCKQGSSQFTKTHM